MIRTIAAVLLALTGLAVAHNLPPDPSPVPTFTTSHLHP